MCRHGALYSAGENAPAAIWGSGSGEKLQKMRWCLGAERKKCRSWESYRPDRTCAGSMRKDVTTRVCLVSSLLRRSQALAGGTEGSKTRITGNEPNPRLLWARASANDAPAVLMLTPNFVLAGGV